MQNWIQATFRDDLIQITIEAVDSQIRFQSVFCVDSQVSLPASVAKAGWKQLEGLNKTSIEEPLQSLSPFILWWWHCSLTTEQNEGRAWFLVRCVLENEKDRFICSCPWHCSGNYLVLEVPDQLTGSELFDCLVSQHCLCKQEVRHCNLTAR